MGLADAVGAYCAFLNLPEGSGGDGDDRVEDELLRGRARGPRGGPLAAAAPRQQRRSWSRPISTTRPASTSPASRRRKPCSEDAAALDPARGAPRERLRRRRRGATETVTVDDTTTVTVTETTTVAATTTAHAVRRQTAAPADWDGLPQPLPADGDAARRRVQRLRRERRRALGARSRRRHRRVRRREASEASSRSFQATSAGEGGGSERLAHARRPVRRLGPLAALRPDAEPAPGRDVADRHRPVGAALPRGPRAPGVLARRLSLATRPPGRGSRRGGRAPPC